MARRQRGRAARAQDSSSHHAVTLISDDDDDDSGDDDVPLVALVARRQQAQQRAAAAAAAADVIDMANSSEDTAVGGSPAAASAAAAAPGAAVPDGPAAAAAAAGAAAEPAGAAAATAEEDSDDADADESGSSCIICMELMSEQGGHRPAALKCGHIFGNDCIRKWLQAKPRCPQCNKSSKARDITPLFNLPKKVAAGAVSSSAVLEQELKSEQQKRRKLEQEIQRLQQQVAQQQQQEPRQHRQLRSARSHQQEQSAWESMQQQHLPPGYLPGMLPPGHPGMPDAAAAAAAWSAATAAAAAAVARSDGLLAGPAFAPPPGPLQGAAPCVMAPAGHSSLLGGGGRQRQHHLQLGGQVLNQNLAAAPVGGLPPGLHYGQPPAASAQASAWQQQQQWYQQQQQQQPAGGLSGRKRCLEPGGAGTQTLPAAAAAGAAAAARERAAATAAAAVAAAAAAGQGPPGVGGGSSGRRSSVGRQGCRQLALVPCAGAAPPGGSYSPDERWPGGWLLQLQGCFAPLQEFEVASSRALHLDAPGALLVVAEAPPGAAGGGSRLRRISMVAPGAPNYLQLPPAAGGVRCLAAQPPGGASFLAVATARGGLVVAAPHTNNIVQAIPAPAGVSVWSAAWSSSNSQQLLLGLDRGRMALADLRMSSSRALMAVTGGANSSSSSSSSQQQGPAAAACGSSRPTQPLHTVAVLQPGWLERQQQQQQQREGAADVDGPDMQELPAEPEALVACAGGVYCWSSEQPDAFQQLLPASCHGGTCESLCLDPCSATVVASFRAPLAAGGGGAGAAAVPVHLKAALAEAPPAAPHLVQGGSGSSSTAQDARQWGQQQLMAQTLRMHGHSSSKAMTHGCLLPGLPEASLEPLLFASACEATCEPRVWGCGSGAQLLQPRPWRPLSSPVLQLAGGRSEAFHALLLGALSERQLVLYSYEGAL